MTWVLAPSGPGTLYPLLHRLEPAGYLSREGKEGGGKVRKDYAITEAGRDALTEAQAKSRELVGEVVDGQGPVALPNHDEAGEGNDA